jgi:SAM-dependent methyltransferase
MNSVCRICGHGTGNKTYTCREQMFGLRDEFTYFQCAQCGCLQIGTVPPELGRYYPTHYYSFSLPPASRRGGRAWLAGRRDLAAATGVGWLFQAVGSWVPARPEVVCLGRVPLRQEMRILDVGCGRGQLLSILHRAGFRQLAGVDPLLPSDLEVVPGLWVRKRPLGSVEETFDLVMLHHVFEHVENGLEMLTACRERLSPEGKILLRIPTVESEAWERYREHWVQLDAPRHLFLHTRASLAALAGRAGLGVTESWCDSSGFQFWGSELYLKGIPLMPPDGRAADPASHFSRPQLEQFERAAQALNAAQRGDQMAAILRPAGSGHEPPR